MFMTDPKLWDFFETPLILVFQADTLVCHPINIQQFITKRYDYIGGASLKKKVSGENLNTVGMNTNHLNGGIALHRREWTLACAKKIIELNEDAKWNACHPKPVSLLDVFSFGSDNGYTSCFNFTCPSVVHKPWVHASTFDLNQMKKKCPRLEHMQIMWHKWQQNMQIS